MTDDVQDSGNGDLAELEQLLRELDPSDLDLPAPPPQVWSAIESQVSVEPGSVVSIARPAKHRGRLLLLAAAAAVVIGLVTGAVLGWVSRNDGTEVVSTAVLLHDPQTFDPRGADSSARARLVERDGEFEIELTDANLPAVAGDDLELWLIEPDADGNPKDIAPVSLINASETTYRVPAGLDPASHYVVDISIEPRDGDASHSGHSILRGSLQPESSDPQAVR